MSSIGQVQELLPEQKIPHERNRSKTNVVPFGLRLDHRFRHADHQLGWRSSRLITLG